MSMRYRVRDWGVHFENSRSRDYKKLDWVPIPNKHDGKGYRRLIALENGPALFAAWVLIVQVASKCPQRGVLADEDGALTAEDLAMKTGCPAEVFAQAFDMLCHPKIGWLEVEQLAADDPQSVSTLTESVRVLTASVSVVPLNRTEENRTEEKRNKGAAAAAGEVRPAKALKAKDTGKAQEPIPVPAELDTPETRQALEEWREHRRQKRNRLTPIQESKLLAEWAAKGSERFVAAVNRSIAGGWSGIFEAEANGQRPAQQDDPRGNRAAGRDYLEMFGGTEQ